MAGSECECNGMGQSVTCATVYVSLTRRVLYCTVSVDCERVAICWFGHFCTRRNESNHSDVLAQVASASRLAYNNNNLTKRRKRRSRAPKKGKEKRKESEMFVVLICSLIRFCSTRNLDSKQLTRGFTIS